MKITESWKNIVSSLVSTYESLKLKSGLVTFNSQQFTTCVPENVDSYFCPNVFVWDPVKPAIVDHPINCPDHVCSILETNLWMDGSTNSRAPRICLDMKGPSLLISREYKCEMIDHRFRTTDVRIIRQCERYSQELVFTYKMACTVDFLVYVTRLVCDGNSFKKIKESITEIVLNNIFTAKKKYVLDCETWNCKVEHDKLDLLEKLLLDMIPSERSIEDLFLAWFSELEDGLCCEMASLESKVIMIDHTFKLATGVQGIRAGEEKTHIKLFKTLFVVINEKKEVVSWQLAFSEKFSLIEKCLKEIITKNSIKMIIMDNCCKWEKKIHTLLDDNVLVKLDPFHAIQRITCSIKKNHPYHDSLCSELKNLFRRSTDMQGSRKQQTDTSENILTRFDNLLDKWERIDPLLDGPSLISVEMKAACDNLRKHIIKGCISDIPPGCSTSINENLHKNLNKLYKGHCMGPKLNYAVLSVYFYLWNRKLNCHNQSILALRYKKKFSNEVYGFSGNLLQLDGKWVQQPARFYNCSLLCKYYLYLFFKKLKDELELRLFLREDMTQDCYSKLGGNSCSNKSNFNFEELKFENELVDTFNVYTAIAISVADFYREKKSFFAIKSHFASIGMSENIEKNCTIISEFELNDQIETLQAIANFLKVTIVVITNSENIPVIPIYAKLALENMQWLFLYSNDQRFQAITPVKDNIQPVKKTKFSCNCGRKSESKALACAPSKHYASRCLCFKNQQSCQGCNCKNCQNPFGRGMVQTSGQTRVRQPSQLSTQRTTTLQFLEEKKEIPVKGPWSTLETVVFIIAFEKMSCSFEESSKVFNIFAKNLAKKGYQISEKSEKEFRAKIVAAQSKKQYFDAIVQDSKVLELSNMKSIVEEK